MGSQIHKILTDEEVAQILKLYASKKVLLEQALILLGVKRRRFFDILKIYREGPDTFSVRYQRTKPTRSIDKKIEDKIIQELKNEKRLIEDKNNPIHFYNYSYVKNRLENKYNVEVSLPTIIRRAKKLGITKQSQRRTLMIERC